jgi:hypothetical protein
MPTTLTGATRAGPHLTTAVLAIAGTCAGPICEAQSGLQVLPVPLNKPPTHGCFLSGDGTTVIGVLPEGGAARWRPGGAPEPLGNFNPSGIDRTGSVICGRPVDSLTEFASYLWTASDGLRTIPPPEGFHRFSAFSTSGSRVAGNLDGPGGMKAVLWSASEGFRIIDPMLGGDWAVAYAITPTGAVAGSSKFGNSLRGFYSYIDYGHTQVLGGPGGSSGFAWASNSQGNVFLGQVPMEDEDVWFSAGIPHRACTWDYLGNPSVLRQPPNTQRSWAKHASDWVNVIVGTAYGEGLGYRATAWGPSRRPVDLRRLAVCAGADESLPQFFDALSISDDGTRILVMASGGGLYLITGFSAPNSPTTDLNWDGNIDGTDLGMLLNAWGACTASCDADFDRSGSVDGADLGTLLNAWGSCAH